MENWIYYERVRQHHNEENGWMAKKKWQLLEKNLCQTYVVHWKHSVWNRHIIHLTPNIKCQIDFHSYRERTRNKKKSCRFILAKRMRCQEDYRLLLYFDLYLFVSLPFFHTFFCCFPFYHCVFVRLSFSQYKFVFFFIFSRIDSFFCSSTENSFFFIVLAFMEPCNPITCHRIFHPTLFSWHFHSEHADTNITLYSFQITYA